VPLLQVYSTPLVGVWVKGPAGVLHPLVAAACWRFAYSSLLIDRAVNPEDGAFLLLLCPEGGWSGMQQCAARSLVMYCCSSGFPAAQKQQGIAWRQAHPYKEVLLSLGGPPSVPTMHLALHGPTECQRPLMC